MDTTDTLDRLDRERALLADVLSLRWFHWAIVTLSLATTVAGWQLALDAAEAKAARRFEHEAVAAIDALAWRLEHAPGTVDPADAPAREDGRAEAARGAVANLMSGTLAPERRLVGLAVSRGGETLWEDVPAPGSPAPERRLERALATGDGWRAIAWSTPELERRSRRYLPWAVLGGGLVAEALLLALFLVQARGARRTLALAEETAALWSRLREKAAELERANAELESFACVASHDLKAPLAGAGMLLRSVLEDLEGADADGAAPDAADVLSRLRRLDGRLDRMQGLIDGILAWGAVGAGDGAAEPVDVADAVRRIGHELGVRDDQVRPAASLPTLVTDRARLEQVLANLVGNAFKYHPDPARAIVRVSAERAGARTCLHVDDDGAGVPEEDRARVFAMFDTGTRGASRADATGLGLAIVAKSVELVGGTVAVGDSPSGGARFSFTWPARSDELARLDRTVADAAAEPAPVPAPERDEEPLGARARRAA